MFRRITFHDFMSDIDKVIKDIDEEISKELDEILDEVVNESYKKKRKKKQKGKTLIEIVDQQEILKEPVDEIAIAGVCPIKRIIVSEPAIVLVTKSDNVYRSLCSDDDIFDAEKGFSVALSKMLATNEEVMDIELSEFYKLLDLMNRFQRGLESELFKKAKETVKKYERGDM